MAPLASGNEIVENRSVGGPKTTIRYALWGGASEVQYAREICESFVKKHPEIRMDVAVYPWGQYWAKVQTQIASGLAPDVMSFYSGNFGVWVDRGALAPLNDLAKRSGLDLNRFYSAAIENCTWQGKLYCIPMEMPAWTLVYSKDRMEESGIPRSQWPKPDKPLTWQEFTALAKRLTLRRPDGTFVQYGMAAGKGWDDVMADMCGGRRVDRQVNPTRSTVAGNEKLARAYIQLFQAQYGDRTMLGQVPLSAGSFVSQDALLMSPRFAMYISGPWGLKQLQEAGVRFGVAPMPRNESPVQHINVNSVGINSATKHVDEAWLFLEHMASEPVQRIYGLQLKGVPALKAASDSLVHNAYGIEGCEAYLYDLAIATPSVTSSNTYLPSAQDNWLSRTEQMLDREYDRRLAALKRVNGAIPPAEYRRFVDGMNAFVEKTVRAQLPKLEEEQSKAFTRAKVKPSSTVERTVAPVALLVVLVVFVAGYVRWVRKNNAALPPGPKRSNLAGYLFIAPWLIGVVCFVTGPILAAIGFSFCKWNMISPPQWVGVQNYLSLPGNDKFVIGLLTTAKYALLVIPISLFGGLFTAGLLTCRIKGADFFKAILYFPALFTGAEAAVLWVNMLNKEHGVWNYILSWFGVAPINWMDESHAFYAVILMNVFWIGSAMIIYYAGMKQIPAALYEAADIDGASPFRKFFSVTIPMLSPVILFMVIMTTIGAFQVFTPALFFASASSAIGQPGDALRFYAVNVYDEAFNNLRMGSACCYAIILFLIIFVITMLQMKFSQRYVHTEAS